MDGWTLIELPPNKTAIGCKYLEPTIMFGGAFRKHKAWQIDKDFLQSSNPQYDLTWIILSTDFSSDWHVHQVDVNNVLFEWLPSNLHDSTFEFYH